MTQTASASATSASIREIPTHMFDFVKLSWLWIGLSVVLLVPGIIIMLMSMQTYPNHAPLKLGIDFTGGTMLEYGFEKQLSQSDLPAMKETLAKLGVSDAVIQLQDGGSKLKGQLRQAETTESYQAHQAAAKAKKNPNRDANKSISEMFQESEAGAVKNETLSAVNSVVSIRTQDLTTEKTLAIQSELKKTYGAFTVLQKNRVGPVLAEELFVKASWALILAYTMIVIYLTFRFQLDYAVTAIVALVHDSIFLISVFSMMGWFFHIEVNAMFVTAVLTCVGFSVHDTIVVFDRIRENLRVYYTKKLPFQTIVNISLNQTMARSINTSLTALVTLGALYLLGGESTQHFVLAMIIGIGVGTYSSIFVASMLLCWWRTRKESGGVSSSTTKPQTT